MTGTEPSSYHPGQAEQAKGRMIQGYEALTEREKETLRLLLVGHDAKSMAQHFGLSVHTINERLRDARRKLAVSSSKEAARLVHGIEQADPQTIGDSMIGAAIAGPIDQQRAQPGAGPLIGGRAAVAFGGLIMISIIAAALALLAPTAPAAQDAGAPAVAPPPVAETTVSTAARTWLGLVDQAKWAESWAATGQSFRALNTVERWQGASETARVPLGRMLSRRLLSQEEAPAPPNGVTVVRFLTDFANKHAAIETLSLDQEGDAWKVVGIYIN